MAQTVLEELVVKMLADVQGYVKDMRQAADETKKANEEIRRQTEQSERSLGTAFNAMAAGLAALGAKRWIDGAIHEWNIAETTALRLESAIRAGGRSVDAVMPAYREFASAIQEVTVIGDDATLAVLAQAESFDLSGQAAIRAARHATALAGINGGAAGSYLRLTAAIERGDTELAMRMSRMVPQLRGVRDETEFLARANQLFTAGMAAARAEAQSFSGQTAQLANSYGDLMEEFGKSFAGRLLPFVTILKDVVKWFQELDQEWKDMIVAVAAATAAITTAIATWSAGKFVLDAFSGSVLGLKMALVSLAAVAVYQLIVSPLNQAVERAEQLDRRLSDMQSRRNAGELADINLLHPTERRSALEEAQARAEQRVADLRERTRGLGVQRERAARSNASPGERWMEFGRIAEEMASVAAATTTAQEQLDRLRQALADLGKEEEARPLKAFLDAFTELQQKIREVGMTEQEVARQRLRDQGATEQQMMEFEDAQNTLDLLNAQVSVRDDIRDRIDQMNAAIEAGIPGGEDAVRIQRARAEGYEEEADELERLIGLEEHRQYVEEVAVRAHRLAEQFDPRVRFQRQVDALNEVMASETPLTVEQYNKAMAKYREELEGTAAAASSAANAVERLQAAQSGTLESSARLADYIAGATERAGGPGGTISHLGNSTYGEGALFSPPTSNPSSDDGVIVMRQILDRLRMIHEEGGTELVGVGAGAGGG